MKETPAIFDNTHRLPSWVNALLETCSQALQPMGPIGRLDSRIDMEAGEPWTVLVYPTCNEIKGGARDGAISQSGFEIDIGVLLDAFNNEPSEIRWVAPAAYTREFDGPHLMLSGDVMGRPVTLRLFADAPPSSQPALWLHPDTGKISRIDKTRSRK